MMLRFGRIAAVSTLAFALAAATIPTKAEAFGFLLAPALIGSAIIGAGAYGPGVYGGGGCCQVYAPPPPPCCQVYAPPPPQLCCVYGGGYGGYGAGYGGGYGRGYYGY